MIYVIKFRFCFVYCQSRILAFTCRVCVRAHVCLLNNELQISTDYRLKLKPLTL